jgi:predicted metalloprotease with PDZ domain
MIRAVLTALAAAGLLGAAKVPTVGYRLGVEPVAGAAPLATVEIRLQGDADGETRIALPDHYGFGRDVWRYLSDFSVKGAEVTAPDPAHRVLRHRPGAPLVIRYRVQTAYPQDPPGEEGNTYRGPLLRPNWFALLGDYVFATPEGRAHEAATFRWGRLPKGWHAASDLEHGAMGRPLSVADVAESITVGGTAIQVTESADVPGLRVVRPNAAEAFPATLPDEISRTVAAQRGFWNDVAQPYFVALVPLAAKASGGRSTGGTGRGDGFILYATPGHGGDLGWTIAHEHTHTWIAGRLGRMAPEPEEAAAYWLSEGFTDFFAVRTLLRGGLITPEAAVARLDRGLTAYDRNPARTAPASRIVAEFWTNDDIEQLPYQRGALLALKWDEDIRRKTGGKADLDDVVLRMRDHYRQFPPGQGPDVVTGFVSAAWIVAGLDLRPEIAGYAERGEPVPLPEQLFDGCVDTRTTVTPAYDAGFDPAGSVAAKVMRGVRAGGPAWNSGLRDGMRIDRVDLTPGDTSREIRLTVRPANGGGRPREIRYWPYGDKDIETRRLQLAFGLEGHRLTTCGRKVGGL